MYGHTTYVQSLAFLLYIVETSFALLLSAFELFV